MDRTKMPRWMPHGLALALTLSSGLLVPLLQARMGLNKAVPPEKVADVRKLLKDPSPVVRSRTALALAEANDADAIPVLIDLLAELPADECKTIEEYLRQLAGAWTPPFSHLGRDANVWKQRRDAWRKWWRTADGKAQLAVIHQHTPTPQLRRKVKARIDQLGDDAFERREAADKELFHLGRVALPQLRQARANPDAEIAQRARHLIERIELDSKSRLPAAAVRLVGLRKPDGASAALLAYLPLAEEENLGDEIKNALVALALRDGKLDAALLRALDDELPLVRAVAAEALVRGGGRRGRAAVGKRLQKDTPLVRLRIALALVQTGDEDGVPVLIDLLAALPDEQVGEAEEALYQLAGDTPPKRSASANKDDNKNRREVWTVWWKSNAGRVDLTRFRVPPVLGYTLICDKTANRVYEIDRHGKERWAIDNVRTPLDAVVLPGNRVLIAECNTGRVTERDFQGNILWEKQINYPVNVQRLPNGHTFIATDGGPIVEVDRAGKEIYSIKPESGKVLAAARSRRGDIVCLTTGGRCRILDTTGKLLTDFASGHTDIGRGVIDLRPNGNILVAQQWALKVVEFDRGGKKVMEAGVSCILTANHSPNGNILVTRTNPFYIYELNRAGESVWEHKINGVIYRARRR